MLIALAAVTGWTFIHPPKRHQGEIEQLVSTETHMTAVYDAAVAQFSSGR